MAEESQQDRTYDATPRKKQQAREKGQIPRSRELNSTLLLLASSVFLLLYGKYIYRALTDNMQHSFSFSREVLVNNHSLITYLGTEVKHVGVVLLPFFILLLIVTVSSPMMLGGWLFNIGLAAPKAERLNPINGLKKMFSLQSLVELAKSFVKFSLLITTGYFLLRKDFAHILGLTGEDLHYSVAEGLSILGGNFIILSSVMIVIVLFDVPYQIWSHNKKLKMTFQEIKDEMKQTDVNPEVKGRIRKIQMEMSQKRMMEELPKADVVITNPTHYAVALSYKPEKSIAPIVVAKGMDFMAESIRDAAKKYKIEIISAPPLARSIYFNAELFKEIPKGLYVAVAQVLAYIYQLRQYRIGKADKPALPEELPVPEELAR